MCIDSFREMNLFLLRLSNSVRTENLSVLHQQTNGRPYFHSSLNLKLYIIPFRCRPAAKFLLYVYFVNFRFLGHRLQNDPHSELNEFISCFIGKEKLYKSESEKGKTAVSRNIMTLTAGDGALTVNCEARLIARKGQLYTKNDVIVRTATLNTEK